jgi:hemerythrin-like domain-containing protein
MSHVIAELRQDHRNMARILDLLAREMIAFKEGRTPDYYLVESILDYTLDFPHAVHHPKEDLLFERLKLRAPEAAAGVGDLAREHATLETLTRRFAAAVANVLRDEELPRGWFLDVANDYLGFVRRHMQMEEVTLFPAALRALAPADWDEIDALVHAAVDPLFGGNADERYRALYDEIVEWGRMFPEPGNA